MSTGGAHKGAGRKPIAEPARRTESTMSIFDLVDELEEQIFPKKIHWIKDWINRALHRKHK